MPPQIIISTLQIQHPPIPWGPPHFSSPHRRDLAARTHATAPPLPAAPRASPRLGCFPLTPARCLLLPLAPLTAGSGEHGGAGFLRRRAASPFGCCHETACLRGSSSPILLDSPHCQPSSSPRRPFSRRRRRQDASSRQWRQRLTSSAPQRLASTHPSRVDLHGASRPHMGRRQHHNITSRAL